MNTLLDAALKYAAGGLALLPLVGKVPAARLLPAGDGDRLAQLQNTPATESDIRQWFADMPSINIGVFSGAGICQILGVDLDPGKCPDNDRAALLRDQGGPTRELAPGVVLPSSPLHVLTGGGRHVYYRHPPVQVRCVTRIGHAAAPYVDVQAEGRYLVIPPSIHPTTGGVYQWVDEHDHPIDIDDAIALLAALPIAPDWIVRAEADDRSGVDAPRVQSGQWISLAWTLPIPEGGRPGGTGGRKQTLRSLVQYYAREGLPVDVAIAQLTAWNQAICRPPLDATDIVSITHWMYDRVVSEQRIETIDRVNLRSSGPAWPHDLFLGSRFGRWVDAVAQTRGVHPDLVAVCGLGALGCAATGGYNLHYLEPGVTIDDHHWVAPSALWVMPIAESGGRKSAAYREVEHILQATNETMSTVAKRYNVEREACEEDLNTARKAATARMADNRDAAVEARREIVQRIANLPAPMGERWILSEATPEAFLRSLSESGHLALLSEEGDETIKKFFGQYSGVGDMNGILKSWDGGKTIQARIGRGILEVQGVASILAMVQPRVLNQLSGANAEDRGLMARFLFAATPPPIDGAPVTITKASAAMIRIEFADAIRAIYYGGTLAAAEASERADAYRPEYEPDPHARPCPIDAARARGGGYVEPEAMRIRRPNTRAPIDVLFTGESVELLRALEDDLRSASIEGGAHYMIRTWTRKAHEHAMRIATVIYLCEHPPIDHEAVAVDAATTRLAIALVNHYFIPHYYIAKELAAAPLHAELGLHILTHFAGRDSFSLSEAGHLVSKRTPDIRPVIDWLEYVGAVRIDLRGKSLTIYPIPGVTY